MQFASIKEKLNSFGIDTAALRPNGVSTHSTVHGTLWVKHYCLTVSDISVNVVIIGSYNGVALGEDGERTISLFEPLGDPKDFNMLDIDELMKRIRKAQAEIEKEQEVEKQKRNTQVAIEAQSYIEETKKSGLTNLVTSAYLERKKIPQQQGTYIEGTIEGTLVIPMVAERGEIWNYQRISPDGTKLFLKDGRISGCYHIVRQAKSNTILVGEGYVTCVSVALALEVKGKRPNVICAFNSGNLPHVVSSLRKLYPQKQIIVIADNDQWKVENTGILAAKKAAAAFIAPEFDLSLEPLREAKPTDFNDLHCLVSLEEVHNQISKGLELINQVITRVNERTAKKARVKEEDKITEIMVAMALREQVGDTVVACGEDLFQWSEKGYWRHLQKGDFAPIHRVISDLFQAESTDKKVKGAFNLFRIHLGQISTDIFTQKKNLCNFQNGTLVFDNGTVSLKPHDKNDLLTYSLPFLCPTSIGAITEGLEGSNPLWATGSKGSFLDMVDGLVEGDGIKKNLIAEMLGSVLFPISPQIFFILGDPNNGKSTIAKLALNLVGYQNCSAVAPSKLYGFNLHQTLGKRVNYELDIPTGRPLVDDVLKKVIDQVPMQIERKNRDSVMATLPPVHIYVGNDLPDLGEGSSKPMERRVSFLHVKRSEIKNPDKQMVERLIQTEFETVIRAAIWGAVSLYKANGAYTKTVDKDEAMLQWELNSSSVHDLVDMFRGDGVPVYDHDGRHTGDFIVHHKEGMVKSAILQSTLKKVFPNLGRNKVLQALAKYGYIPGRTGDSRCVMGLMIKPKEELI